MPRPQPKSVFAASHIFQSLETHSRVTPMMKKAVKMYMLPLSTTSVTQVQWLDEKTVVAKQSVATVILYV
jgi:hypothetical protein